MARLSHGSAVFLDEEDGTTESIKDTVPPSPNLLSCPEPSEFNYLFRDLQDDDASLLPAEPDMAGRLIALGNSMRDPNPLVSDFDSTIPSAYTYFGQFVTHDTKRSSTRVNTVTAS